MLHPSFRRYLDHVFRMSSIEVDRTSSSERGGLSFEAGAEIGNVLADVSQGDGLPRGVAREVLERVAIMVGTAIASLDENDADYRKSRDEIGKAAFIAVMAASDGGFGLARYVRNAGMAPLMLRYGLLRSASQAIDSATRVLSVVKSAGALVWPALATPVDQSLVSFDPGGSEVPTYRPVEPIYWLSHRIASIYDGERLFHAVMAAEALGYQQPRNRVTKLQRTSGLTKKVRYRDPSSPGQRRQTRFLTVAG